MGIYNFNSIFNELDLSLLRYFFAVATFGGFSKAARATGISQPSLSLGLMRLEKSLGVMLIDRTARPFELTRAGHALLTFCQRLQGGFETLLSSMGSAEISVQRRLEVGTAISIGLRPLEALCERIEQLPDSYELDFAVRNTYQLLRDVGEGRLDAAFVPNDVYDSRLKFVPMVEDRIVFVVGAKHRGTVGRNNWRQSVATMPLITFPRDAPMRTLTDKICVTEKAEFKTIYSVDSIDALKILVEQGRGGAFVLRTLVENELRAGRVFEEKIPVKLPRSGIALALPPPESQSAGARSLLKLMTEKT
jgi:DNA-binding transcriptional LysR family regulator